MEFLTKFWGLFWSRPHVSSYISFVPFYHFFLYIQDFCFWKVRLSCILDYCEWSLAQLLIQSTAFRICKFLGFTVNAWTWFWALLKSVLQHFRAVDFGFVSGFFRRRFLELFFVWIRFIYAIGFRGIEGFICMGNLCWIRLSCYFESEGWEVIEIVLHFEDASGFELNARIIHRGN